MPTLGRYTLLRRVAAGGMAEIWKAKVQGPAGFSKTVAIKKVLPHLADDEAFVEMFIAEAKLVAELVHPNIVQVFDFGELAPREYFIAMEYISGANLSRLAKRVSEKGGRMPAGVALYIVLEAARGLGAAHMKTSPEGAQLNIVHRDVSPQNILVSFGGEVKVSDFGIAKAASASSRTAEGMVRGKLAYMSPEQANARPLDGRSDLFSLGIILYELLTAERLFNAPSAPEIYAMVSKFAGLSPEQKAKLPKGTEAVVSAILEPDLGKRVRHALQMEQMLSSMLGSDGVLRARTMLASMMQALFDEERRMETTPTETIDPGAGVVGAMSASTGMETISSPTTPAAISALTLGSKVNVQAAAPIQPVVAPPPAGKRPGIALLALAGAGVFVVLVLAGAGIHALVQGSPTPAALAAVSPSPVATVSAPRSSATPTAPVIASRPTQAPTSVSVTPTRVVIAPTPPPTPVVSRAKGTVNVKSRPWVQVWVDGRMVTKETPLRDYSLASGTHQFRFINEALKYDVAKTITVPANETITLSIDVAKNTISQQ